MNELDVLLGADGVVLGAEDDEEPNLNNLTTYRKKYGIIILVAVMNDTKGKRRRR